MTIASFTPVPALLGGVLIGLAAALCWTLLGRIAGISGIVGGLLVRSDSDTGWRAAFVVGLVAAPAAWRLLGGEIAPVAVPALPLALAGGLLVGFGTRLGSGCTSGHGVCGIARLSPRSLAATATFMAAGFATVFVMRHLLAGATP